MSDPLPLSDNPNFEHLRDIIQSGNCVLFLGAGVSMDSGAPTGGQLTQELSKSYFPTEPAYTDLGLVAEAIDAGPGRRDLNSWLTQRFKGLTPQGALLSIPTYHWKSIYTVNFDELLEAAYEQVPNARQRLRPFYSSKDQMEGLGPDEVRYYKLHGSISRANSDDGRLVLSADDMLGVGESRQRFLNRLYDDLHEYTLFYVGFGRLDLDFRQIIAMVEKAASNPQDLRRSYALQPSLTPSQVITWEKKRVTLIGAKAAPFFEELNTALPEWARYAPENPPTAPPVSSFTQKFPQVTQHLMLDVARNYEIIDERIKAVEPNTEEFFVGAQPNWGLIASGADAKRDLSDEIMGVVLKDEHLDRGDVQCVLIHAEAGSGKTTLLRRIGVDLALSWHRIVVSLKSIGRIEFVPLERLAQATKKRIYLLIDDATDSAGDLSKLLNKAKHAKTKLTVITNARSNEWRDASVDYNLEGIEQFELKPLSRREIDGVLITLADHNALGHLNEVSYEAQVAAFEKSADKQLLVALREATVGKNFDEIIIDEFDNIPSPDGQKAYLLVAALHRFGIPTRAGLLHRALHLPLKEVGRKVLDPTAKIIIVQQPIGDEDIYYTTRHPVIADIVFDRKLMNERRRREYYEELVTNLDLGYSSDLNAYNKLSRGKNKQLLRDF
ncbi:MAG: hypothetical protein QOF01_3618 [Thermomicrobiales bacterium]|nr:hypothetical protein [Thermomicrobiales bacterium]